MPATQVAADDYVDARLLTIAPMLMVISVTACLHYDYCADILAMNYPILKGSMIKARENCAAVICRPKAGTLLAG